MLRANNTDALHLNSNFSTGSVRSTPHVHDMQMCYHADKEKKGNDGISTLAI